MKFYIRRAVAGIVAIPFVAGAWCFIYLAFIAIGGEPTQSLGETYNNGILIASVVAVMFTFAPQVEKFLAKISGE
jgi:TM2 domain-containing membrane protein YozV